MTLETNSLNATCPRCGHVLEAGARFCANCGLPIEPAIGASPIPVPPVPYAPPGAMPSWAGGVVPMPVPAPGAGAERSVVIALTPKRPATWAFWVGLVMSVGALAFAICPLLLAGAFALDPESNDPSNLFGGGLLVAGCVVVGLLLPGILLIFAGRPRK